MFIPQQFKMTEQERVLCVNPLLSVCSDSHTEITTETWVRFGLVCCCVASIKKMNYSWANVNVAQVNTLALSRSSWLDWVSRYSTYRGLFSILVVVSGLTLPTKCSTAGIVWQITMIIKGRLTPQHNSTRFHVIDAKCYWFLYAFIVSLTDMITMSCCWIAVINNSPFFFFHV